MNTSNRFGILFFSLLVMALMTFVFSCGGSDGGDDDDDVLNDDDVDDDASGDDDDVAGDDDATAGVVTGYVLDFLTVQPVSGAVVELLNGETTESFDPQVTAHTDDEGYFEFESTAPIDEGPFAISITHAGYERSVTFGVLRNTVAREFFAVSNAVIADAYDSLSVTRDVGAVTIVGGLSYNKTEDSDGEEIGCAEISLDPSGGEVFYFGDSGLSDGREVTTPGSPRNGEGTNPNGSGFIVVNIPVGGYELTAFTDQRIATLELPAIPAGAVVMAAIVVKGDDFPTNPTPAWCTE